MSDTKLELTPRELAIAQGKDPSAVEVETETVSEDAGKESHEESEKESPETDSGGKEAIGKEADGSVEQPASDAKKGGDKEVPSSTESVESKTWIDDEAKSLAQSYNLSDEELQGFGSAAEFKKFATFLDRQLVKPVKEEPAKTSEKPGEKKKLDLDLEKYKAAGYDEDTLAIVEFAKAQKEELESLKPVVEQMRQTFAAAEQQRQINAFHDAVDTLGDKRFGLSVDESGRMGKLSKAEDDARRKLYEASETLVAGIVTRAKAAGKQPEIPPPAVLLRRAKNLAFGEDLKDEAKREATQKIAEQGKRRRPVGNSRAVVVPAPKGATTNEFAKSIADHPDVVNLWNKYQAENGK